MAPGTMASSKTLGASSTYATKFPQPWETAVENPILLPNTQIHTNPPIGVCLDLAVSFILYFWEREKNNISMLQNERDIR